MTKKQAYKIITDHYGKYDGIFYRPKFLCYYAPKPLIKKWRIYWNEINTTCYSSVLEPFSDKKATLTVQNIDKYRIEIDLTRLMLLHDFVEKTYK